LAQKTANTMLKNQAIVNQRRRGEGLTLIAEEVTVVSAIKKN